LRLPDADGLDIKSTSVLTGSVHTTVNALREAIAVQRMLERDARGGTRYIEIIKAQCMTSKDTLTTSISFKMESMTKGIIRN
jgi:hypothetical protein